MVGSLTSRVCHRPGNDLRWSPILGDGEAPTDGIERLLLESPEDEMPFKFKSHCGGDS